MRSFGKSLIVSIAVIALTAPAAIAQNSGEGLYGETDDKVVTYAGFILIVAFPVIILLCSLLQGKLERRKDARKRAAKAAGGDGRWKNGW
ncbi:MAG TPA: hypothetical protein VNT22_02735 [Baekduia sp.]|nr:hypothetical protein [Baekduia sp.]